MNRRKLKRKKHIKEQIKKKMFEVIGKQKRNRSE